MSFIAPIIDKLTADTTVNLDNSMSAADIQALIDAQPKNLNGFNLIFQFADGTYTLDTSLIFIAFNGGGTLYILGKGSDSSLSTTKSVYLNFTSGNCDGIQYLSSSAHGYIRFLKIGVNNSTTDRHALYLFNANYVRVRQNYLLGTGTTYGRGSMSVGTSHVNYNENYIGTINTGIRQQGGTAYAFNNDDTTTTPTFGLYVDEGCHMGTSGTNPSGTSANTTAVNGGLITAV